LSALQYQKLALAASRLCDLRKEQTNKLVRLASSICQSPAVTIEERQAPKTSLQVLLDTGENHRQINACDEGLFLVLALNAKGIAQSRIIAAYAANLLADVARNASEDESPAALKKLKRKRPACSLLYSFLTVFNAHCMTLSAKQNILQRKKKSPTACPG
jgi:hypothetical protein